MLLLDYRAQKYFRGTTKGQPNSANSSVQFWSISAMPGDIIDTICDLISSHYVESSLGDLFMPDVGIQTGPFGSQLHASDY